MTVTAAAIQGTFSDYRLVKTRKVLQLVIEVPIEQQGQVFECLGYPMPDKEHWVAVARMNGPAEKPKGGERAKQAGIACQDSRFCEWLANEYIDQWAGDETVDSDAELIRRICMVASRAELDHNEEAGKRWDALYARYRQEMGLEAERR